jgi:LacI family transcriptional regulator, galactose operon repressor
LAIVAQVTSIDVARLAGVSQATVSRALRDVRGTSEATRAKVRAAARELGYVPQQSGRSLSTRLTNRVGIVTGELANPFYPALVAPMVERLHEHGYLAVLVPDKDLDDLDPIPLIDGSLDGVLLTTIHQDSHLPAALSRRGVPRVLVNRDVSRGEEDASVADNVAGAGQVADLMLSAGHRRIAFLGGPPTVRTNVQRAEAFRAALEGRGIECGAPLWSCGRFDLDHGRDAFTRFMALAAPPTAVFCANDVLAIGALEAARAARLAVPHDVTVVGFDDIPLAALSLIDLTTVGCDLGAMGRSAADLLIDRIADPGRPARKVVHPTRLVLRGTHGRPPLRPSENPNPDF